MRRVRYAVAMSLDGFIDDPEGKHDWIVMDPSYDFDAFFRTIDTILLGRRTFEVTGGGGMPGMRTYVFSRTLSQKDHPKVTVVNGDAAETVAALRKEDGKDIWLMGGGVLFRSLLDAGLVDTVEVGIVPVLLGDGVPLLPPGGRVRLELTQSGATGGNIGATYKVVRTPSSSNSSSGSKSTRPARTRNAHATRKE